MSNKNWGSEEEKQKKKTIWRNDGQEQHQMKNMTLYKTIKSTRSVNYKSKYIQFFLIILLPFKDDWLHEQK